MLAELEKRNDQNRKTGREVTDAEWAQAAELLASVTVNDPKVRVH